MWKNRADLYNLIVNMKAHIYICGGAKMAADVTKMLENILLENDNKISKDCIKELKVILILKYFRLVIIQMKLLRRKCSYMKIFLVEIQRDKPFFNAVTVNFILLFKPKYF